MAEAVKELYPETQVTFGPATETGFYYDFARDDAVHPRRPGPDRGADARDRAPRRADHARGLGPRRRRRASSTASASATRPNISARSRPTQDISLYRQGDFVDLCVGPHLPSTGPARAGLQADERGRRLLARRPEQRAAAARLRHGVAEPEGARPVPVPARRGRAPRPPQARPRARPVPSAGGGGRQRLLAPEGLDAVPRDRGLHAPPARRGRLSRGQGRRSCSTAACGRRRATGRISARTCSSPRAATSACSRSSR